MTLHNGVYYICVFFIFIFVCKKKGGGEGGPERVNGIL